MAAHGDRPGGAVPAPGEPAPASARQPVLVIVLLIALAVVPAFLQLRIRALRSGIVDVAEPARALVTELQQQLMLEAAGARAYLLTGDASYAETYRDARNARAAAFERLLALVPDLPPSVAEDTDELAVLFQASDSVFAGVYDGRIPVERYVEMLPRRQDALTRMTAAVARLDHHTAEAIAEHRRTIRTAERAGAVVISLLALLALASAVAVARLVVERREALEQRERLLEAERRARAASEEARAETDRERRELERMTESRAGLMRGFGHDVKNPLGAARGYLDLLEEGVLGTVNERQTESLARARRAVRSTQR
jgi:CHASE3 domain sensor protein